MKYLVKLKKREVVARETMAFLFEKPREFLFQAGQYVNMTIPQKLDVNDPNNIHSFSIASGPFEDYLMFAVRLRKSTFKNALKKLRIGETVTIQGPLDEFTLPAKTNRPLVFLAGGIGITPFVSMVRQIMHDNRSYTITLFYSNRTPADSAFLDQLRGYAMKNSRITIVAVMSQAQGYINEALLKQYITDINAPLYYIAGSPMFVGAMQATLWRLGVLMDSLKLDEFTGY